MERLLNGGILVAMFYCFSCKMIGPMSKEEIFVADDYSLLEKTVMDHYGTAIMALVLF